VVHREPEAPPVTQTEESEAEEPEAETTAPQETKGTPPKEIP